MARPVPVRPSAERVARLAALGRLHAEWAAEHRGEAEFMPEGRPEGSDYNLHYLDVNPPVAAEDEFHQRAKAIFGLI
jgi:hypothetical protein